MERGVGDVIANKVICPPGVSQGSSGANSEQFENLSIHKYELNTDVGLRKR